MGVIREFDFSLRDFAVAETHVEFIQREITRTLDDTLETLVKMDITLDSIKVPNTQLIQMINEYAELVKNEFTRVNNAISEKKREFLKTDEDYSSYDQVKAEARSHFEKDLKSVTSSAKSQVPVF